MTQPTTTTTRVFVTGFGPFPGVEVNPSTTIAKHVAQFLSTQENVSVELTILETSVYETNAFFTPLEKQIDDVLAANGDTRILLFHCGVHGGELNGVIHPEIQGYNELHTSVPDVRGVMYDHEAISADKGAGTDVSFISAFGREEDGTLQQLQGIIDNLNKKKPVEGESDRQLVTWEVSRNAGRYLCNYCLYRSLSIQDKYPGRVASIFVHVSDPQRGQRASPDGPITQYNPTDVEQAEEVKDFALQLIHMLGQLKVAN